MSIEDLKARFNKKDLKFGPKKKDHINLKNYYSGHHQEPHEDFLYGLLCMIYDGIHKIDQIKSKMRVMFISSTKQVVIEEEDVEEYLQNAKKDALIKYRSQGELELTAKGKAVVELSYQWNLHSSHYMGLLFSKTTVIIASAIFLIILSSLKIIVGFQLNSEGMFSEGFENLTDLVKIAIIVIISMKLKKDKLASVIIILTMIFTGCSLIINSIFSLFSPKIIIPTLEAYAIGIISIIMNLGLAILKGMVGRSSGNLSLLSDAKDSQLNIQLSASVLIGLTFAIFKIYYVDTLVGIIIAILVLKEGIEIIVELIREVDFDITAIKVYADNIYENRLTCYLLGSIRRETLTRDTLMDNFIQGLELGRRYYIGFADFFYDDLGEKIATKHLNKLIEGKYLQETNNELILTEKGLRAFYKAKVKEFKQRSNNIEVGSQKVFKGLSCIMFIIILVLLIIFSQEINNFLSSFF